MRSTVKAAAVITPDNSLPTRAHAMARAELPDNGRSEIASALSDGFKETARKVFGKQGAAAAQAGQAESNFSRDLDVVARKLAPLGPEYLAEIGRQWVETYAPLSSPAARARELARRQQDIARELESLAEYIA